MDTSRNNDILNKENLRKIQYLLMAESGNVLTSSSTEGWKKEQRHSRYRKSQEYIFFNYEKRYRTRSRNILKIIFRYKRMRKISMWCGKGLSFEQ